MTLNFYYTIDADSVRPYMPAVPVLVPASSWARRAKYQSLPASPALPAHVPEVAVDPGGFVFTLRQRRDYPFTDSELVDFAAGMGAIWCAAKDYCCEPEITAGQGAVTERQARTTEAAWRAWQDHKAAPFCWVPTIQGWEPDDYTRHAAELRPLVEEMSQHYGPDSAFRVGIGTLCRRASVKMIRQVVLAVAAELPQGVKFHLWGVKLSALKPHGKNLVKLPPQVLSCDSAAWNGYFGRDHEVAKAERSAMGITKREHAYSMALPRYADKVQAALESTGQLPLL